MTTARRASSSPTCRSRTCRAAPTSSSAPSASQHPQLAGRRLSADDPTIPLRHVRDGRAGAALRRLSERPFREQRCGGRSARRYAGVDASGRDSHRRLSAEIAPRSVSRGSHPAGGRDRSTAWRAPAARRGRQPTASSGAGASRAAGTDRSSESPRTTGNNPVPRVRNRRLGNAPRGDCSDRVLAVASTRGRH